MDFPFALVNLGPEEGKVDLQGKRLRAGPVSTKHLLWVLLSLRKMCCAAPVGGGAISDKMVGDNAAMAAGALSSFPSHTRAGCSAWLSSLLPKGSWYQQRRRRRWPLAEQDRESLLYEWWLWEWEFHRKGDCL